jgi:cytochrome c553
MLKTVQKYLKALAVGVTLGLPAVGSAALDPAIKGSIDSGALKKSTCVGCHGIPGYKTAFPLVYRVPKIAGQSELYLQSALTAYRSGERSHPSMKGIAMALTDQDIADLSAYYANKK